MVAAGATNRYGHLLDKGVLYRLLNNRVYIGEAVHKGVSYPGEHEAIVDRKLWDEAHAILRESPRKRAANTRAQTPALLRGLLFGPNGAAMSPTHTRKGGRLYRYYISQSVMKRGTEACPVKQVPAAEIERIVIYQIRSLLQTPEIIRKTLIAAVHRVRQPGCKFDTILVLESVEGWNKSSVWRLLAGDENFSDARIIGREGREVQEQLASIWIHENAELQGMRKAEIETVKSFASRQEDIARPAYARFQKRQLRHSIEVGTTNANTYLQSQTGNRRFWPLKVTRPIDLDLVSRNCMQLWGEAAFYESKGESIVLDRSLWKEAGLEQEKRRVSAACCLAEEMEARMAKGEKIRIDEHAVLSSTLVKIAARIGVNRRSRNITPTLRDYLDDQIDAIEGESVE